MNTKPRHSSSSSEPSDAGTLGPFEERLLGELKTVIASRAIREHPGQAQTQLARSPRRRRRWMVITALSLAAAVAAGMVAATVRHPAAGPAARYALAADFLNHAAAAARAQNTSPPKAGQVFYFEQLQDSDLGFLPGWTGRQRRCLVMWQPSPLTGASAVVFGTGRCGSGVPALPVGYRQMFSQDTGHWYPAPDSLPTTPAALRAALGAAAARGGDYWGLPRDPSGQIVFALTSRLLEAPVAGSLRAALYEMIAQLPGVSLVQNATDAAGRHGTGILLQVHGASTTLVIEPGTYRFLGWTVVSPQGVVHTADLSSGLVTPPRS